MKKKARAAKGSPGRPTKYREEFAQTAYKLCLLGATNDELADFFNVAGSTVDLWLARHAEFKRQVTAGRKIADANVAERLYQRAMGYEHDDVYPSSFQGDVTLTTIRKHYPPDTQAASLWLRNRQPEKWRDKQQLEHAGPDGGPIQFQRIERTIVDPADPDS